MSLHTRVAYTVGLIPFVKYSNAFIGFGHPAEDRILPI
jgi:hypothetical protein